MRGIPSSRNNEERAESPRPTSLSPQRPLKGQQPTLNLSRDRALCFCLSVSDHSEESALICISDTEWTDCDVSVAPPARITDNSQFRQRKTQKAALDEGGGFTRTKLMWDALTQTPEPSERLEDQLRFYSSNVQNLALFISYPMHDEPVCFFLHVFIYFAEHYVNRATTTSFMEKGGDRPATVPGVQKCLIHQIVLSTDQ